MRKITRTQVVLIVAVSLAAVYVIMLGLETTPTGLKQRATLGTIRDCTWYGFKEYIILHKADGEKAQIVLPESLMAYTPVAVHFDLKEIAGLTDECDLIYNPKGYEDKTWIVIYNTDDFWSRLLGNYVLWSDKEIKRKRGIIEDVKTAQGLKYYSRSASD